MWRKHTTLEKIEGGSNDEVRQGNIKECARESIENHREYKHVSTIWVHNDHPDEQEVILGDKTTNGRS
jgi:hypothetical protein